MLDNKKIEEQFNSLNEVKHVSVESDGYHYHLTLVSDVFKGKSKVARQQWVYARLKQYVADGSLHALSMKTLTEDEWREQHG